MNMYRYAIELEEIDDPRYLKQLLEDIGDTYVSIQGKTRLTMDTSESLADICEALKEEGYGIISIEMIG